MNGSHWASTAHEASPVDWSSFTPILNNLAWTPQQNNTPTLSVDDLGAYAGQYNTSGWETTIWDGEKFAGGFGITEITETDYWTIRARSADLFKKNLYAKGIIRRLVTNEINTGITPEVVPDEEIIGLAENSLDDWSETVENRFAIYTNDKNLCDWKKQSTFGIIQQTARREALIEGDVLVVLRPDKITGLSRIQLVSGSNIQTPIEFNIPKSHTIKHGVEMDKDGRNFAFWVKQSDGTYKRLLANGAKSGRETAWLVFGTEKRHDEVRGMPMLALIMQSAKDIDKYRDATLSKAKLNAYKVMAVEKGENRPGSLPITGGATKKTSTTTTDSDGVTQTRNAIGMAPNMIFEELAFGEKIHSFGGEGTDINFGEFEEAIVQAMAWANEIPPEIVRLAFSNNYSASQAAINEFKIYLNMFWGVFGSAFLTPIYKDFLLTESLTGKIKAPGLLDAWRNPMSYDIWGAWCAVMWYGSIKPSTDTLKQGKGSKLLISEGLSTRAREARGTTGTKYSKNVKKLAKENVQLANALRPLLELEREFGAEAVSKASESALTADDVQAMIEEHMEEAA